MKEALEDLPEQFRMAVLLADVEGFSYKEIAEIMDVPIGTVMSRLHRGRKQLQKRLWDLAEERGLVPSGSHQRGTRSGGAIGRWIATGAVPRVYHYLDGELTVWKRRAITRHLDECPPCAQGFYFEIEIRRVVVDAVPGRGARRAAPPDRRRSAPPSDVAPTSADDATRVARPTMSVRDPASEHQLTREEVRSASCPSSLSVLLSCSRHPPCEHRR